MSWSLFNGMIATEVAALLDHEHVRHDLKDEERAMSREQCLAVIHGALWAYTSRAGSTASAYAFHNLYDSLNLESWTFKESPSDSGPE
jgi:hypothetical protein